jgi:hypothetical protein
MDQIPSSNEKITRFRPDNQIDSQIEIVRDPETKERIRSTETLWSYYETGEVDTIAIVEKDALEKVVSQTSIKHYLDGRQPICE